MHVMLLINSAFILKTLVRSYYTPCKKNMNSETATQPIQPERLT